MLDFAAARPYKRGMTTTTKTKTTAAEIEAFKRGVVVKTSEEIYRWGDRFIKVTTTWKTTLFTADDPLLVALGLPARFATDAHREVRDLFARRELTGAERERFLEGLDRRGAA